MAHVRGTKNKIKPLTWATFNNPFPKKKKKKNKQNKTYKKRRNWNAGLAKKKEEEGEEAKKKKKKKKKGIKASEYGDSGASNPLVFSLLSKFFFSPADFLLPVVTHRYSADTIRIGANRPGSMRVGARRSRIGASRRESGNEKKKLDAVRRAGSSVPRVSPRQTRVRRPFCRVRAS